MWFKIDSMEKELVIPFFEQKSIPLNKVAHRCGLTVMPEYTLKAGVAVNENLELFNENLSNYKPISFALIEASDKLLRSLGYEAVIVTPSNKSSRRVFEQSDYQFIDGFKLMLGEMSEIPDDYFCGMYKLL
jgi:hypothetical protein